MANLFHYYKDSLFTKKMASLGLIRRTLEFRSDFRDLVLQACDRYKINYGAVHEGIVYSHTEAYAKDEKDFEKLKESMEICNIRLEITEFIW